MKEAARTGYRHQSSNRHFAAKKEKKYRLIVTDHITIQARNTTKCAPVTFNQNDRSSSPEYAQTDFFAHRYCHLCVTPLLVSHRSTTSCI